MGKRLTISRPADFAMSMGLRRLEFISRAGFIKRFEVSPMCAE